VALVDEATERPDDPPMGFEARMRRIGAPPPLGVVQRRWVGLEGDEVVAYAFCQTWPDSDPDNSLVHVSVRPRHRRRGIGTRMLGHVLETIRAEGRGKVIIDSLSGVEWEPWLERLGLKRSLTDRASRIRISDVDMALMGSWMARATERAGEYELVYLETPVPEEHLAEWAKVKNAINDQPHEDLEWEELVMTPELWRSYEGFYHSRGDRGLIYAARHVPSGELVGFTLIFLTGFMPGIAFQSDTAVLDEHRNRGLGRLLKAAMVERLAADHPELEQIETMNAGSNRAMLGINVEMGFETVRMVTAWQGSTHDVLSNLHG
jgi:GNAT superfamily N-acetyltransferase